MRKGSGRKDWGAVPRASARGRRLLAALIVTASLAVGLATTNPHDSIAAGPNAVLTPAGYDANVVPRGDDTSNLVVDLPFTMNWNGTDFTQIYINMNGNCTFGTGFTSYNPNTSLAATNRNIMAPLWADVDTRNTGAAQVTYSTTAPGSIPQVNGRDAFFVNWIGVASYNNQTTPTDSFQLVLVDRSDTGAGNFDFMFNYDEVAWDIATAASTTKARAGWGQSGTGYELPGSGLQSWATSALLDTSDSATSLVQNSLNADGQLGRYVFQVRNGGVPNLPPEVLAREATLEGNVSGGYAGYTGAGDVTAVDPDGAIVSLTNDAPATLPLGDTYITWTAEDDAGATTTAVQVVHVQDTTAPDNPTLTSPSHVTSSWSADNSVQILSTGASDLCSGVGGVSYSWSLDTTITPDLTYDLSTTSSGTVVMPVTVDQQTFESDVWPSDWTRSSSTWVTLTNATGRSNGSYAAEIFANSNTRRTEDFFRDYDLTLLTDATLSFWQNHSLSRNGSYGRVEYSVDGGANYTTLSEVTRADASGSTQASYALPVGGVVRVRFAASVARSSEYVDWDDIAVAGSITTTAETLTTDTTDTLADGIWYFNLHTGDNAGNWSAPVSIGPFWIDTLPPVTTDDAPDDWSDAPVTVTLTAVDAGVVSATYYRIDGGIPQLYSTPFVVSAEGTTTVEYWSVDEAGHTESPMQSALVRVDTQPPPMPTDLGAVAIAADSVEVTWTPSVDSVSGVAWYTIYRDGSFVATTTAATLVDTGLTSGQTYDYTVTAVDAAGNESAQPTPVSVFVPSAILWMSLSTNTVDTGAIDPGTISTVSDATVVTVGGYGDMLYDLSCSAEDFANTDPLSPTPTLGIDVMQYATRGWVSLPLQTFSLATHLIDAGSGQPDLWEHDYVFDYSLDAPWTCEPGTYTTTVTYTVVLH